MVMSLPTHHLWVKYLSVKCTSGKISYSKTTHSHSLYDNTILIIYSHWKINSQTEMYLSIPRQSALDHTYPRILHIPILNQLYTKIHCFGQFFVSDKIFCDLHLFCYSLRKVDFSIWDIFCQWNGVIGEGCRFEWASAKLNDSDRKIQVSGIKVGRCRSVKT